jgi:hypothetical protein
MRREEGKNAKETRRKTQIDPQIAQIAQIEKTASKANPPTTHFNL